MTDCYYKDEGWFHEDNLVLGGEYGWRGAWPTHWMPLPEPPETENK